MQTEKLTWKQHRFGNHKDATSKTKLLRELVLLDIENGYSLVIPLSALNKIPGVIVAPMNIQQQNTIFKSAEK